MTCLKGKLKELKKEIDKAKVEKDWNKAYKLILVYDSLKNNQ